MLETQKPNTMHWASENDKNFIAELISGKKNKRLIWDGYLPNGKKKQYWENKDIDWELHLTGQLKQGGNLCFEIDGKKYAKAAVVDIDQEVDAKEICSELFSLDPKAIPIKSMGRFSHEAVAFDPATGDAFLTEDRSDSLFYRFIPNQTGNLSKGKLFALSIEGHPQDTRNWKNRFYLKGVRYKVRWLPLNDTDPKDDSLRSKGADKGASIFARGEGVASDGRSIYFTCTSGGSQKSGQIWKYTPGPTKYSSGDILELWQEINNIDF